MLAVITKRFRNKVRSAVEIIFQQVSQVGKNTIPVMDFFPFFCVSQLPNVLEHLNFNEVVKVVAWIYRTNYRCVLHFQNFLTFLEAWESF